MAGLPGYRGGAQPRARPRHCGGDAARGGGAAEAGGAAGQTARRGGTEGLRGDVLGLRGGGGVPAKTGGCGGMGK